MGSTTNSLILIYFVGAVILNSCYLIAHNPQREPGQEVRSSKAKVQGDRNAGSIGSSLERPPIDRVIDGLKLSSEGPNCWNGALIKMGLVQSVRFVSKAEYWFWMTSPYCRELPADQEPQLGDLGSLFWKTMGHYHSFVYLNNAWVFSKNSPDPKYEYKVQRFEDMFYQNRRSDARVCWAQHRNELRKKNSLVVNDIEPGDKIGNTGASMVRNSKPMSLEFSPRCDFRLIFHRCHSLEKNFFMKENDIAFFNQRIEPLEKIVFEWVTTSDHKLVKDYKFAIEKLHLLLKEIQQRKTSASDSKKLFKFEALEYRVLGLILSDINIGQKIPDLHIIINNAYQIQDEKKNLKVSHFNFNQSEN